MTGSEIVRYMMRETKTTNKRLAELLEINEQSMYNKLYRNSFSYAEINRIADLLGFAIKVEKRER